MKRAALENDDGNGNGKKLTPPICRNASKNYYGVTCISLSFVLKI
jgi:hypothetical protein